MSVSSSNFLPDLDEVDDIVDDFPDYHDFQEQKKLESTPDTPSGVQSKCQVITGPRPHRCLTDCAPVHWPCWQVFCYLSFQEYCTCIARFRFEWKSQPGLNFVGRCASCFLTVERKATRSTLSLPVPEIDWILVKVHFRTISRCYNLFHICYFSLSIWWIVHLYPNMWK